MTGTETIPAGDCFGDLKACPACIGDARECPLSWPEPGPPVDCLVCFGDDPECPWPHDADPFPGDGADTPPTLDQLAEMYPDPGSECE